MKANLVIGVQKPFERSFEVRWAEALEGAGVQVRWVDLLAPDPLSQIAGCDGVMWHWYHYPYEHRLAALPILRVIEEHLRIPVFPDMATCWHYDDKISQSYLLEALGVPIPKTWVFWRKEDALAWSAKVEYPLVAKLSSGAGSLNVRLIRDEQAARLYIAECFSGAGFLVRRPLPPTPVRRAWRLAMRMVKRFALSFPYVLAGRFPPLPDPINWMPHKNHVLFQEFLPGNDFDTRVTVIGNRAFAFRRMNRPGDFRASGSGRIDHDPAQIDIRCVKAAFAAVRSLKSQSMAFDYLYRGADREPVVGEISYAYVDRAVERCPGHWDGDLNWHEGHVWPQDAHVEDFLARIRRQPSVDKTI